jgi:protein TonB
VKRLLPLLLAAACAGEPEPLTLPRQVGGPVVQSARAAGAAPVLYPEELWDAGVEGTTLLRVHITAEGVVDSARVERTSGYDAFDDAALAGSRGVRFEPARRGAEAVAAWFILPVEFDLGPAADSASERPASSSQQAGFR